VHLEPEVLVDRRDRAVGVGGPDAEADRVCGLRLRNKDDADTATRVRAELPIGHPGYD